MDKEIKKIGIIAGAGLLPRTVFDSCNAQNIDCTVLGIEGQVSKELFEDIELQTIPLYSISKLLSALRKNDVTHIVLAGKVERKNLSKLLFDLKGAVLLTHIIKGGRNDNSVLSAVITFLEKEGFVILPPEHVARNITAKKGVLTKLEPDQSALDDIKKGVRILKNIASFDVGQALVIQAGLVLGVEAAEGTDELIKRCGLIQQKDEPAAILVKIVKPDQDRRVDLPCVGPHTITMLREYGLRGVAMEAGSSLILDEKSAIEEANKAGIFIVGI